MDFNSSCRSQHLPVSFIYVRYEAKAVVQPEQSWMRVLIDVFLGRARYD